MPPQFQDELLLSYSEADLTELILQSPRLPDNGSICLLSNSYVAKFSYANEIEDTMQAVRVARQLGIRTPTVKRVVKFNANDAYCVMDRIHGATLEEVWPKLSWLTKARLAMQLRQSIRRLRSVTSSTAGSLATGRCKSFWLEDYYGLPPQSNPEDVAGFISVLV